MQVISEPSPGRDTRHGIVTRRRPWTKGSAQGSLLSRGSPKQLITEPGTMAEIDSLETMPRRSRPMTAATSPPPKCYPPLPMIVLAGPLGTAVEYKSSQGLRRISHYSPGRGNIPLRLIGTKCNFTCNRTGESCPRPICRSPAQRKDHPDGQSRGSNARRVHFVAGCGRCGFPRNGGKGRRQPDIRRISTA